VTAVSSPLFRSLTSTTLCGFRDFRNDAASIAKSFRIAISARRAVYSYFELCALCSRHVTKWRRVLPPAGVALIAAPPTCLRVGCVVHAADASVLGLMGWRLKPESDERATWPAPRRGFFVRVPGNVCNQPRGSPLRWWACCVPERSASPLWQNTMDAFSPASPLTRGFCLSPLPPSAEAVRVGSGAV
jgi:hypothetical protein